MLLILAALVVGVVVGLAFGGSFRNLAQVRFRWWGLAFLAAGLQFVPVPSMAGRLDEWIGAGLLIASYAVVVVFVVLNLRVAGLWLIAAGFALNMVVIALNGGMPVSDHALRAARGDGYEAERRELRQGGGVKHHLARPDDVAVPLADVIPVGAPVGQVLSAGDIVWLVGTVWVVVGLMLKEGRDGAAADDATPKRGGASNRAPRSTPSHRPGRSPAPEPPGPPEASAPR